MTKRAVIITSSVIICLLMILTILFGVVFRVREINVVCGEDFYYKAQIDQIVTDSKLKKNSSIFEVNRNKVVENIETNYAYARVKVNLSSLTSVKITLSNREPLYYFAQEGVYYILDEDCKILENTTDESLANQYILLNNIFSVEKDTKAGNFLKNKYTAVCNSLYKALYTNATVDTDSGEGTYFEKYLEREDIINIVSSVKFTQTDELIGRVDVLNIDTSYGVKITIVHPQSGLDNKINMAFSALRALMEQDRTNSTTLSTSGSINIIYSYDDNRNPIVGCEYRA